MHSEMCIVYSDLRLYLCHFIHADGSSWIHRAVDTVVLWRMKRVTPCNTIGHLAQCCGDDPLVAKKVAPCLQVARPERPERRERPEKWIPRSRRWGWDHQWPHGESKMWEERVEVLEGFVLLCPEEFFNQLWKFSQLSPAVLWVCSQCMCNWWNFPTQTLASEEQRFSQAHCNAFRPKLDSSGGLSKNMLGQGYQVKLFQHHPNNLASEAFNCFFEKKKNTPQPRPKPCGVSY